MRRSIVLSAASALAFMIAAPALAQDSVPIEVGATVRGAIDADDASADGPHFDGYQFEARRGQRFEVIMTSEAFDTFLEVYGPSSGDTALGTDDDGMGGETTDSRLRFTAPVDGTYVLRARPLSEGEGAYVLSLIQRPPAGRAPRPTGVRLGQTVRGDLGDRDPEAADGSSYDAFSWRARRGDRILISLDAEDFDPLVRIGRMNDGEFEELAQNDDGGDTGLNSRLIYAAPDNGDYIIRATALNGAGAGAYTLKLEQGPETGPAEAIEIGGSVEGRLSEDDGKGAGGSTADRYRFHGREGQRVRISMSSDDFDAYLELFDESETSLATDDDGAGEGTDSRLIYTLPREADYVIETRAFSEGTGDYTLSIEEMEPEKTPEAMAFDAKLEGEIGEGDSRDASDRGFDAFSFTGREGQRVQATMRSGDFDTLLQLGNAGGGEFEALASDDDGLGEGTDSRLSFTLPADGDYVLRASPLAADGKGLYSLELVDRGPQPKAGSLLVGSTARGTLSETDATAENNSFYDAYRVTLNKDEKLLITMVSNEVDSFLMVGEDKDGDYEMLTSDDDGLSDTHAKVEWTAPEDGTYEIRAGSFQQGQTGAYALNVEKQP
ncbi:MAG: peptidase [Brevundimonas sp.]|nr:MAG: peptidase [Brevundimonas sp.]